MIVEKISCITGASGLIGRRIAERLLDSGWSVRALTRGGASFDHRVSVFKGDVRDASPLREFVRGAAAMFHCAAELRDASLMWAVNVDGTKNVVDVVSRSGIDYLCFISSAGVVGNVRENTVDESTKCNPYNLYERSKWAAERIVASGISGCRVVILRPTNVVDETKPGVLNIVSGGFRNRLKLFIKGGECAHVVHAGDVAAAAVYLMDHVSDAPQCYIVSCDENPSNTYAAVHAMHSAYRNGTPSDGRHIPLHLPIFMTHAVRRIVRGKRNRGDVRYLSQKLLSTGFRFQHGLEGAIRKVAEYRS